MTSYKGIYAVDFLETNVLTPVASNVKRLVAVAADNDWELRS